MNNVPLSECTAVSLSSTEGSLGCFQVQAVMNKTAININVQVFVLLYHIYYSIYFISYSLRYEGKDFKPLEF